MVGVVLHCLLGADNKKEKRGREGGDEILKNLEKEGHYQYPLYISINMCV